MKNVLQPLAKSVLILELTAAAGATDAAVQKCFPIRNDNINYFKRRNGWYHESN